MTRLEESVQRMDPQFGSGAIGSGDAGEALAAHLEDVQRRLSAALAAEKQLEAAGKALTDVAALFRTAGEQAISGDRPTLAKGPSATPAPAVLRADPTPAPEARQPLFAGITTPPRDELPSSAGGRAEPALARSCPESPAMVDPFSTETARRIADFFERFVAGSSSEVRKSPQEFRSYLGRQGNMSATVEFERGFWLIGLEGQPVSRCFVVPPADKAPSQTYPNLSTFFLVRTDMPRMPSRQFILDRAAIWQERNQENPVPETVEKGEIRL